MRSFKFIIIIILSITIISCNNNKKEGKIPADVVNNPVTAEDNTDNNEIGIPKFKFEEEEHDFGTILQGEKIKYSFNFQNVGNANLVISNAEADCGCTVPSFPDYAIKPGQKSSIEVVFDSEGKRGYQEKTITIIANTHPNKKVLKIKGTVLTPDDNEYK